MFAAFHVNSNNSEESIILNKARAHQNAHFNSQMEAPLILKVSASAWVAGCLEWTHRIYGFALSDKTNTKRGLYW